MLKKMPTHCGDETCSSCVIAGDFIYLAHHAGGFDKQDIAHQMRATFESMQRTLGQVGANLNDMVQINLYMKDLTDFGTARDIFYEYFDKECFPARMTLTSDFLHKNCLCMMDGVAYKTAVKQPTLADKYLTFTEESKKLMDSKTVDLLIDTFNKVYPKICDFFNNGELLNVIYTAKPNYEHVAAQFVHIINKSDYGVIVDTWEEQHIVFDPQKCFGNDSPSWGVDSITHELVHVAQNSKYEYPSWINEGLADYGRAKFGLYNEKAGWRVIRQLSNNRDYKFGYWVTAAFFIWIEENIDANLPKDLNDTIKAGKYTDNYFVEKTGKTVDELWQIYVDESRTEFIGWLEELIGASLPQDIVDNIKSGRLDDEFDKYILEKTGKSTDDLWVLWLEYEETKK